MIASFKATECILNITRTMIYLHEDDIHVRVEFRVGTHSKSNR